ncbi:c-type cytochrome [Paroceanicella profunda]|uniref:C-type cytochrome n=1 Tax=Paroceanicella profunda TaxID=2579971 RepID=A0A5B8FY26_9RHOB|nr:di-heme oxidoredictase family protein [Paroceanicella profunda]QDL91023.1 c-type cytochrome [Paroceanicella profunda]
MKTLLTGLLLTAVCLPARADPLPGDIHLDVVPRTAAEAERIAAVTAPTTDFTKAEPFEINQGGAATTDFAIGPDVFSQSSANMSFEREMDFKVGNGLFRKLWVSSPSSTTSSDGLGPLYNARGCQNCHLKDGRGRRPIRDDEPTVSLFLRLSVPSTSPLTEQIQGYIATAPDPVYGGQLQNFSVAGVPAEGQMQMVYEDIPVSLPGGEVVTLQKPTYSISDLAYGPMAEGAMISPRLTLQMIGLGLLEAIPEADILAHADPEDADGDGISGRPNIVWSKEFDRPMLGRFGHKAGVPTIRQQSADAFSGDLGLSTPINPSASGDCTVAEEACRAAPDGASPDFEVDQQSLDLVTFYSRNLAVPLRRDVEDPQVLHGKELFYATGCASCHVPKYVTARLKDQPEQSFQLIWPYTDLLLHDMGEGLADNRPEGRATGREWRTPPLWGIGLTKWVSVRDFYLHDGRARSLAEAILWHGGEAQAARDGFAGLEKPDRDAILAFLESL